MRYCVPLLPRRGVRCEICVILEDAGTIWPLMASNGSLGGMGMGCHSLWGVAYIKVCLCDMNDEINCHSVQLAVKIMFNT